MEHTLTHRVRERFAFSDHGSQFENKVPPVVDCNMDLDSMKQDIFCTSATKLTGPN